jgi:hypothetical protein
MSRTSPLPCIDIAPDGDVILELSPTDRYRVYSQVLGAASTVFKGMLSLASSSSENVGLQSRTPNDMPLVVRIEDDDVAVLQIVLRVLHYQLKFVPRMLSVEDLAQAAIICDKYLLHESIQLIARIWVENSKPKAEEYPGYWLLISWVFGPETIFTEVSRQLILGASEDNQKGLRIGSERLELPKFVPAAIAGSLLSCAYLIFAYNVAIHRPDCKFSRKVYQRDSLLHRRPGRKLSSRRQGIGRAMLKEDQAVRRLTAGTALSKRTRERYRNLERQREGNRRRCAEARGPELRKLATLESNLICEPLLSQLR